MNAHRWDALRERFEHLRNRTAVLRDAHRNLMHQPQSPAVRLLHFKQLEAHRVELAQLTQDIRRTREPYLPATVFSRAVPARTAPVDLNATIAHEVRQPLTAVTLNAIAGIRVLEQPSPDVSDVRDALVDILAEARRAEEIAERVLGLYRTQAVRRVRVDLNDIVRQSIERARPQLDRAKVTLFTALSPEPPFVDGDDTLLQAALSNLLTNAMEAVEDEQPEDRAIEITSFRGSPGMVGVAIRDTGTGLTKAHLAELFNGHQTTKAGGTGIGLSLSRSIIETHNGYLWVEKHRNGGVTFAFALPHARPPASPT